MKIKLRKQLKKDSCALACLAMILNKPESSVEADFQIYGISKPLKTNVLAYLVKNGLFPILSETKCMANQTQLCFLEMEYGKHCVIYNNGQYLEPSKNWNFTDVYIEQRIFERYTILNCNDLTIKNV